MSFKPLNTVTLTNLTADPATATDGDTYFNTTLNTIRVYFEDAWHDISDSTLINNATGFVDRTQSQISFDPVGRNFQIYPTDPDGTFTIYVNGNQFIQEGLDDYQIPNTTALYKVFYDVDGNLSVDTGFPDFENEAMIAYIYWDASASTAIYFAEERHGIVMDWATHEYLHRTVGTVLVNGFSISNYTLGGNGSLDAQAQFSLTGGLMFDEDLQINITDSSSTSIEFAQVLSPQAVLPVWYKQTVGGIDVWKSNVANTFPVITSTVMDYNYYDSALDEWSLQPATTGSATRYIAMWIVATNNISNPVVAIVGQNVFTGLNAAKNGSNWDDLNLDSLPVAELRPLYRLIYSTDAQYTNTPKASLQDIVDIREITSITQGAGSNDHGSLWGLGDDDHPQYLLVTDAASTYLTQANAASTYLTQASANTTFGTFVQKTVADTITANHTFTNGMTVTGGTISSSANINLSNTADYVGMNVTNLSTTSTSNSFINLLNSTYTGLAIGQNSTSRSVTYAGPNDAYIYESIIGADINYVVDGGSHKWFTQVLTNTAAMSLTNNTLTVNESLITTNATTRNLYFNDGTTTTTQTIAFPGLGGWINAAGAISFSAEASKTVNLQTEAVGTSSMSVGATTVNLTSDNISLFSQNGGTTRRFQVTDTGWSATNNGTVPGLIFANESPTVTQTTAFPGRGGWTNAAGNILFQSAATDYVLLQTSATNSALVGVDAATVNLEAAGTIVGLSATGINSFASTYNFYSSSSGSSDLWLTMNASEWRSTINGEVPGLVFTNDTTATVQTEAFPGRGGWSTTGSLNLYGNTLGSSLLLGSTSASLNRDSTHLELNNGGILLTGATLDLFNVRMAAQFEEKLFVYDPANADGQVLVGNTTYPSTAKGTLIVRSNANGTPIDQSNISLLNGAGNTELWRIGARDGGNLSFHTPSVNNVLTVFPSGSGAGISAGALNTLSTPTLPVNRLVPVHARRKTGDQSIPNGTDTTCFFETAYTELENSPLLSGITSGGTTFTNISGATRTFLIYYQIGWGSNATGTRVAWIRLGGNNGRRLAQNLVNAVSGDGTIQTGTAVITLANNAFFDIRVYQSGNPGGVTIPGVTSIAGNDAGYSTHMSITWL